MSGWKVVVVDAGAIVFLKMIVRLSERIIVGMFVVVTAVGTVVVAGVGGPRLVRSDWHVDAVSCLQPVGRRFGCSVSASRRRRCYQT